MEEKRKSLTVSLEVKELMFNIMNTTYLTGDAREASGVMNYEAASKMQASEDEENSYQLRRSIASAFSRVKSILGEYLDESKTTTDNLIASEIEEDSTLTLTFKLPSNYNNASADSLGNGIHAYIVDMAVADWYMIFDKADAQDYIQHAEMSLETVKRALYKRSRPTRPSYNE